MNVAIIGTGYVGLVSGICFAEIGHKVLCIDNDRSKIASLKKGQSPIYEPGLEKLLKKNIKAGRIQFSSRIEDGVKNSLVIFIAVNTPPLPNGSADLSYVANVACEIARHLKEYRAIVDKSTVPVKTGEKVMTMIKRYCPKEVDFDVVSNPEFLREGSAIEDMLHPDRIVVGVASKKAEKIMRDLYRPIQTKFVVTDIPSAELIKHASNSFLATKISFANALANICERTGADVEEVVAGMGLDKRIGAAFLNAGIGYGGSCFPKDVSAFIQIADDLGYSFDLLKSVQNINEQQKEFFVKKLKDLIWVLKDKNIGVLGLAFKPNTDDMRNAPSIDIIEMITKEGAHVKAYDPQAMKKSRTFFKGISYCKNPYDVVKNSDALLLLTEWDEFKELDYAKIKRLMNSPIILDGRKILDTTAKLRLGYI
ncbi:MAG: UDP-glucose/GDP-mannose dehydrogenase family protein, partial [Chlamydiota bacterium]|nr:UDP-glucose/GDP-mannose dehydrogenase family protein [Chlamydiota bacterium]